MSDRTVLELEHITKSYGEVAALSDVSLAVRGGEIHAISTPGHGARFDLYLPCQPPPHLPEENT